MNVSSNVDRRTVMELYMPPFEAAVNAGVGSVMCSCEFLSSLTEHVVLSHPHYPPNYSSYLLK